MVNSKRHSIWFVPTGMKGLPQNVLLNFWLEFPKGDLTIYFPSGIPDIFCQMVSTHGNYFSLRFLESKNPSKFVRICRIIRLDGYWYKSEQW